MRRLFIVIFELMVSILVTSQTYNPYRKVEYIEDGVIVTYSIDSLIQTTDPIYPNAKTWIIPYFAQNEESEEPEYPFCTDVFAVPNGTNVELEIINCVYSDTTYILAPAKPPIPISEDFDEIPILPIKSYSGFFPNSIVSKSDVHHYRGQGLIDVKVTPVWYDMEHEIVRFYSYIKYKITFIDNNGVKKRGVVTNNDVATNMIVGSDNFIQNIALNYTSVQKRQFLPRSSPLAAQADNRGYLIITTDSLLEAARRFAEWKRIKGFRVFLESRNVWHSVDSVKSVITNHYYQDSIMYVLNLGGINEIPSKYIEFDYITGSDTLNYDHVSDLNYTLMDNDTIIDLYLGRIPVTSIQDANIVVNKIIKYEKDPPTLSSFYNTALHCAYFQDDRKWGQTTSGSFGWINGRDSIEDRLFTVNSELIKDYMELQGKTVNRVYYTENNVFPLRWITTWRIYPPQDYPIQYQNGDTIPEYLQKGPPSPDRVNWNTNYNDIINQINNGVFYVLQRDHGFENCWGSPAFFSSHVQLLQNGDLLPVVFSISCLTGRYNTGDCLASRFLTKENGGCVGIFAATRQSFSPTNDRLSIAMFNSIWPTPSTPNVSPTYELAKILNLGLINMFPKGGYPNYTREIFHCFGDPSMMIYTNKPTQIPSPAISFDNDKIYVSTTDGDARISFYTPSNIPIVDSYFGENVEYSTTADSVIICIDRHNYIPYIVTYKKNEFIQNETISDSRSYYSNHIKIGKNVTNTKPEGDVIIDGANLVLQGGTVEVHQGTTIMNSNVQINPQVVPN